MRALLFVLLAAAGLSVPAAPAVAGAGVSPFISMINPDDLDASWHRKYDFSRVDAVYVMSEADAKSVSWKGYVWGPSGAPLIGSVKATVAAAEVRAVVDSSVLSSKMVAIVDDGLLQDLIDDSLVGPCGHEPDIDGTVAAELMSSGVQRALRGLDLGEPAVAVGQKGLRTSPITALSSSVTGSVAVTLINPDSMFRGGWCSANPTPHP